MRTRSTGIDAAMMVTDASAVSQINNWTVSSDGASQHIRSTPHRPRQPLANQTTQKQDKRRALTHIRTIMQLIQIHRLHNRRSARKEPHAHRQRRPNLLLLPHLQRHQQLPRQDRQREIHGRAIRPREDIIPIQYHVIDALALDCGIPRRREGRALHKVQQRGDAEGDVDGDDDEPHGGFHVALREAQQSDGEGSLGPGEGGDGKHGADGDREGELGEVLQREVPDVATVAERDDVGGDAHVDEQADERGD